MGLNWHIPLPGPFSVGGPVFRRGPWRVWRHRGCSIEHRTQRAADSCRNRPAAVAVPAAPRALRAVRELVVACGFASRGLLQRQLGVTLREADEILTALEHDGVLIREGDTGVWHVTHQA